MMLLKIASEIVIDIYHLKCIAYLSLKSKSFIVKYSNH